MVQFSQLGDFPTKKSLLELQGVLNSGFLPGAITMFFGRFGGYLNRHPIPRNGSIPDTTWAICDGANGTPDLRGRFVLSISDTLPMGSTGGTWTKPVNVSGAVGATTLLPEQMPMHLHSIPVYGEGYNSWIGGDPEMEAKHTVFEPVKMRKPIEIEKLYTDESGGYQPHSHSLVIYTGEIDSTPPFFALAYIMKLS